MPLNILVSRYNVPKYNKVYDLIGYDYMNHWLREPLFATNMLPVLFLTNSININLLKFLEIY